MKLLLTGGSGLVGRNLRQRFAKTDWQVLAPGRQELELRDSEAIRQYLRTHRPDAVIHAAGLVGGIALNMSRPFDFAVENLQLGLNLVGACVETEVPRLLNLGSSCMYPKDAASPLREDALLTGELEPTNEGYAIAKIAVARLCEYARVQHGHDYKTVIPSNLYGEFDHFEADRSHLVPAAIVKIHEAKARAHSNVEIWGDGSARREFLFAGDFAEFVCQGMERYSELPPLMNVGLGHDYSVNEYYQAVAKVVGYEGAFVHDLSRPVGMSQKLCDVSRMRFFGFEPPSTLQQGLAKTYEFFLRECV